MPLVRFPVRNEYGLGSQELYLERERDDPKAMLQGVAVAGLVGILRQLGDLAEFAAEVFHGLQEEVMVTSSRSRKLMVRVERIESSLPSLEKSMLAQKSHLHFAYTKGSVWRAHSKIEQNHFINGDLPEFIMDSYEECSDPPRLHLLDRFDRGGPGSCLKRYSDPTFFKKASALSRELNGEKSSKSRKSSRGKKKKSRHRTVASREPSVSNFTDRPQFASVQSDVQISLSPSHSVTTYDATIKSDQEEQPNAFSLRTDSNYIECIFHPTDPDEPEEIEPANVSFTGSQILPDNSIFDLASVDECSRDVDSDDIVQSSLQEQIRASSSSVSWEEKEEIVEPAILQHEHVESDGQGEVKSNVGDIESLVNNEGLFTPMPSQIRSDDVDSEPDNFMDALNTIESESEIDADFQTKHEVERSLHSNNEQVKNQIPGKTAHHLYDLPSNQTEQEMEISFSLNNGGAKYDLPIDQTEQELEQPCNFDSEGTKDGIDELIVDNSDFQFSVLESPFDNPFSSQFRVHEDLPKIAEESSPTAISVNDTIVETVNTETFSKSSAPEELSPQILLNNEVQNESLECQTNFEEKNSVQPVQVWSNGGLLGLEPSKPPVYADVGKGSLGQSNGFNNGDLGKTDELIQNSEIIERNSLKCSTSYQDESNAMSDKKTSWRFLSAVLDTKREKNGYLQLGSFNNNLAQSFGRINGIIPKNEQKVSRDGRALSYEASQLGDMSNGSHISVLSNRIPLNDFQRSLVNTQTRVYRTHSDINLNPMHSPSSSPPLQHMKISFQPPNDSGTSKLKLKFPESGTYMLPSFQLVPEPNSSHHDFGSESDDDTFCRSSPYMSDDRPGNEFESDSEQWDSDDNSQSKENIHIHNLSLKESVSNSSESEENRHENVDVDYGFKNSYAGKCSEPTEANLLPDIPSLGAMNPLFEQEMKNLSDENNFRKSHFPEHPAPQPPPLPPSECRNIKPSFNVTGVVQKSNFEEVDNGTDLKLCSSTIASQSNPNLVNQHLLGSINTPNSDTNLLKQHLENNEDVVLPPRREPEERGSTGNKEVDPIRNGKIVDEKEDFLQQIRTQSFNLRRTGIMTERPNVTTGPVTNARVVAILEKAHAIRQVIGCDDGEDDDSWSEA